MEKGSDIHSVSPPCSRVVHEICGSKCIASLVRLFLKIVHWNEPNAIAANSIYQRTFPHQIWIIRPVARADTEIIAAASISSDFWIRGEWKQPTQAARASSDSQNPPFRVFFSFLFSANNVRLRGRITHGGALPSIKECYRRDQEQMTNEMTDSSRPARRRVLFWKARGPVSLSMT